MSGFILKNHRKNHYTDRKGFTLVEILLVVFLIGILATAAISTYMNSTGVFAFRSAYKKVMSAISMAQIAAVTSNEINNQVPEMYIVKITSDSAVSFADVGTIPERYDPADVLIKNYEFDNYKIEVFDSDNNLLDISSSGNAVSFYYSTGSCDFAVRHNEDLIPKGEFPYIAIKFSEIDGNLFKYIVIFQISGLPQEFNSLPST